MSTAKKPVNSPYAYVLFDLDGTLLDSALDIAYALNQLRKKYQLTPLSYAAVRPVVSLGSPGLLKLGFDVGTDHPRFPALREEFLQFYQRYLSVNSRLFPGINALLTALDHQDISWGIITNKITRLTKITLNLVALSCRPAVLVCADTLTTKKPDPQPMLYACQQLGCTPAQAIYIGDAKNDVIAAHAAGMPAAIVTYGYIPKDGIPPNEWGAEFMFSSVDELHHFLLPPSFCQRPESRPSS